MRRVVVTGVGVVTPFGRTAADLLRGLLEGRSGVRALKSFDPSASPVRIGAEIDGFDAKPFLDKKERKRLGIMPRAMQLGMAAAHLALADAGVAPGSADPERFGVIFGAGTIPHDLGDLAAAGRLSTEPGEVKVDWHRWGKDGLALIPPLWMLNHIPNMPASHVSILNDARGPCNSITMDDVGALLSLGQSMRHVATGRADLMLAGGGDTRIDPVNFVRYVLFAELSRRNDDPARACRPFDRNRDGSALGEGGGVLLLEEREHALRRGAKVYAEMAGFGAAFDLRRDGAGLARAAAAAMKQAGVTPDDLDHVNAHGFGSRADDIWEARGLAAAAPGVEVLALKGALGASGTGCGTVEAAASLAALGAGTLPATLNCDDPDPACPVTVARAPRPVRRPAFLKVSLTSRGQCAAAVFRREG